VEAVVLQLLPIPRQISNDIFGTCPMVRFCAVYCLVLSGVVLAAAAAFFAQYIESDWYLFVSFLGVSSLTGNDNNSVHLQAIDIILIVVVVIMVIAGLIYMARKMCFITVRTLSTFNKQSLESLKQSALLLF
jgi:hypothetical protein